MLIYLLNEVKKLTINYIKLINKIYYIQTNVDNIPKYLEFMMQHYN